VSDFYKNNEAYFTTCMSYEINPYKKGIIMQIDFGDMKLLFKLFIVC